MASGHLRNQKDPNSDYVILAIGVRPLVAPPGAETKAVPTEGCTFIAALIGRLAAARVVTVPIVDIGSILHLDKARRKPSGQPFLSVSQRSVRTR